MYTIHGRFKAQKSVGPNDICKQNPDFFFPCFAFWIVAVLENLDLQDNKASTETYIPLCIKSCVSFFVS